MFLNGNIDEEVMSLMSLQYSNVSRCVVLSPLFCSVLSDGTGLFCPQEDRPDSIRTCPQPAINVKQL